MKTLKRAFTLLVMFAITTLTFTHAQTVFPGKQTIDKKEYLGLVLGNSIPEKYLSDYWEAYLDKFGKVKGKRGNYTIAKAAIPSISANPIQLTSQVFSEQKNQSKVFMALYVDGTYVANYNDQTYKSAESILKDFSDYASIREEVRIADESFTTSEKSYQKLQKDMEEKIKEIERMEKKLDELRAEVERGKVDSQNAIVDLQNKQKSLEALKTRIK